MLWFCDLAGWVLFECFTGVLGGRGLGFGGLWCRCAGCFGGVV